MPSTADPHAPLLRPDYDRSIVNLISSLTGSQALASEHYPPLAEFAALRPEGRPTLLLVIDGLGYQWLQRFPDSFLHRHLAARLTSVFPTTTAAAVTALALGVAPQQHAIPGWFTYLREFGSVVMPLPFMPRGGQRSYAEQGLAAADFLGARALLPQLWRPVSVVQPAYIATSSYSRALFGDVPRQPHQSLEQLFNQLQAALASGDNPLVWGYWTELDALGHQYGIGSPEVEQHFRALDAGLAALAAELAGQDLLLVVSADHGQVDTSPAETVMLEQHPELAALLQLPLCGEPRAAFCYLRHGCGAAFDQYLRSELPFLDSYPSAQLLAEGVFGRGEPSPLLAARIGDRVVLPRDRFVLRDRLVQERFHPMIGIHGGLSAEELYVPLVICQP